MKTQKNITIVYVFTAKFKLIAKHLLKCNKHKYIVFFICQIKKITFRNPAYLPKSTNNHMVDPSPFSMALIEIFFYLC